MVIVPLLGAMRPATILSKVDLPQPDGPSRHTNSPSPMLVVMAARATISLLSTS
jgi:hypothetical protein